MKGTATCQLGGRHIDSPTIDRLRAAAIANTVQSVAGPGSTIVSSPIAATTANHNVSRLVGGRPPVPREDQPTGKRYQAIRRPDRAKQTISVRATVPGPRDESPGACPSVDRAFSSSRTIR